MTNDDAALTIAASTMRDEIPLDKTLEERISFAMRYVRAHADDLLWMTHRADDDLRFRAALAAVLLTATEEERDLIRRSLQPLKMLSAAMQGIPVDFSQLQCEGVIPLNKLWRESAT